jgi:hypothetical protein
MNRFVGLVRTGDALIPEMVADLPWPSCYHLLLGTEYNDFNGLVVISFDLARDAQAVVQKRGGRANLTAARDNLYLNLAADLLQVQQTAIDDLNFRL